MLADIDLILPRFMSQLFFTSNLYSSTTLVPFSLDPQSSMCHQDGFSFFLEGEKGEREDRREGRGKKRELKNS